MSTSTKRSDVNYTLGIDLGTTTVKVALLDNKSRQAVRSASRETKACIYSDLGSSGNEQDAQKILTALQFCVSGLPKEDLLRVKRVGIAGQMHGVLLWRESCGWARNVYGRFEVDHVSQLYTWQDRRCTPEFLSSLPPPKSHLRLSSGFGCTTLFWLQRNQAESTCTYDCAGTIQDFVVAMLCGLEQPKMSIQNAASWGYFDTVTSTWNTDILQEAGFPVHLLPSVLGPGEVAGLMKESWYGIPAGTPVGVALGDLQCSILSRLQHNDDAVLNISTSAQLAFQMLEGFEPPELDMASSIEYFPYFNQRYLAVAASLTGGNVMASFVKLLQQWTHELGLGVPECKIWERLGVLTSDLKDNEQMDNDLEITPTLFGERHDPSRRATVSNITAHNTSLGNVYRATCTGIIRNLHEMMSQDFLLAAGVKRIIGSGTAIVKNAIIQSEIRHQYKLPLVLSTSSQEDAAVGAGLAMMDRQCNRTIGGDGDK